MSKRFYVNWPLSPGPLDLEGPEAHHLAAVSRLRAGDEVCLFNGDGREYPARVVETARRFVRLEVLGVDSPERELPFTLEIAAPVPKGDRAQFLIEKLTELGATTFVPLITARSVIHPSENKQEKLERYVIEASKQCGRNVLMKVADPAKWESYLQEREPGERRILAHRGGHATLPSATSLAPTVRCAVGPEGGFTDDEVAQALAAGWTLLDLGPRTLRVETAALALAALVYSFRSAR